MTDMCRTRLEVENVNYNIRSWCNSYVPRGVFAPLEIQHLVVARRELARAEITQNAKRINNIVERPVVFRRRVVAISEVSIAEFKLQCAARAARNKLLQCVCR